MSPPSTQQRILLADDDHQVRAGVVDLLAEIGFEILEAETGREAVEVVRRTRIDAALLDLHMPECTGLEALPLLRRERQGLPCILCSGDWTSDLERAVLEAGAFGILHKPLQPMLLRREIIRALDTWPQGFFALEGRN